MIEIRRGQDRGHSRFAWLDSRHSFSFGSYHDPGFMGFRALRVINDDVVDPGTGFGMHPHRDMEILTIVHRGALEHKDSLGSGAVVRPGDVQRMTAGTGVLHSETNPSPDEPVRLLQIWILPETAGLEPSYEQRSFDAAFQRVASRDGRDGALSVHQDVEVWRGRIEPDRPVRHEIAPGRHVWVQVVEGELRVCGQRLVTGDGAAVSEEQSVTLEATGPSDVLLFDLA